ncbi:MAG: [Fe-Fe] hydrogenase large subunit C-terminal domain-containing protein [[Clostridium] scindens]
MAIGDKFGIPKGENTLGRLVAALRRSSLTKSMIQLRSRSYRDGRSQKELRRASGIRENLPLFTSCCPAWVKFCENRYPEFREAESLHRLRCPTGDVWRRSKEEARTEGHRRQRRQERRTAKQL